MGIFLWILAAALGLSGCAAESKEPAATAVAAGAGETCAVYWEKEITPALYEEATPYRGAYIDADPAVQGDMGAFEKLVGRDQTVYQRRIRLGDEYPGQWVLECFARQALPVLTVSGDYNEAEVEKLAEQAGSLQLPLLVDLFPDYGGDPAEYIQNWNAARTLFAQKAPQAAFLWMGEQAADLRYYPGDENVDWVGVRLRFTGEKDSWTGFSFLYFTFQQKKPLLVDLAVAGYASQGSRYEVGYAEATLLDAYETLLSYPRVKAVVYQDLSTATGVPAGVAGYDYRITGDERLLAAYRTAMDGATLPDGLLRSAFPGIWVGGQAYLEENSLRRELGILPVGEGRAANGKMFYLASDKLHARKEDRKIFLSLGT